MKPVTFRYPNCRKASIPTARRESVIFSAIKTAISQLLNMEKRRRQLLPVLPALIYFYLELMTIRQNWLPKDLVKQRSYKEAVPMPKTMVLTTKNYPKPDAN